MKDLKNILEDIKQRYEIIRKSKNASGILKGKMVG
jgi:hypothetical protein